MSVIIDKARQLRPIIEKAVKGLGNNDALKAVSLYPKWREKVELNAGDRVSFKDELYKVKQGHTTQADWTPDVAVSLFEKVCETSEGTMDDPIPYGGNMELEAGKYYIQNGAVYLCTTGVVAYHALADLVGLYVEKIN